MIGNPFPLKHNARKSFQGSIVLGKGFVLNSDEAQKLIAKDSRNKEVLFPYLNGDDLNNDIEQKPSRWVINFFDWSEEKARAYPDCFKILEERVKPERQRWKTDENGEEIIGTYALRKPLPQKWWIYGEKRPALYETISQLDQVMVINRYSKHLTPDFQPRTIVFSDSIVVIALDSYRQLTVLSSIMHDVWAWKNSSTMGASTLRYSASKAFESFPLLMTDSNSLEEIGHSLWQFRKNLMSKTKVGLTELYNLYHNPKLKASHESYADIIKLRMIHCDIDKMVLKAYGWSDIQLLHNFYEMEHLPENDRIRLSIDPDARREILQRLLFLNHKEHHSEAYLEKSANKNTLELSVSPDLFTNQHD